MTDLARIDQLTEDIAENRVPGGSAFARAAAELIALRTADIPDSADLVALRREITQVSKWAAATKPSMAVVRNVADLAQSVAETPAHDTAALKAAVQQAMSQFRDRSLAAVEALGANAQELIVEDSTVLIHSYSASLESLLRVACASGTRFRLLVTESRPYRESRRLIDAVVDSPVEIVLYSDAGMFQAAAAADLVLLGADSVFVDGSFANKTGSLGIALGCREHGVPLYVATELAKLYFGDIDDIDMEMRPAEELADGWEPIQSGRVKVWNQFFERVDAAFVHRYVTEAGLLAPHQMRSEAARSWRTVQSVDRERGA